ncbi:MAG: TPM domain-containing protein [Geodermatophilales bacterium]|nr:TPM domain-containing protein [Geodermatophilales bacterium]
MRRLSVVLGLLAVLLVGAGSPALADPPLGVTGRITDTVGALQGDEDQVRQAIDDLEKNKGISEYVVFVSGFDGINGEEWARQTAQQSNLGPQDVLLAVAVDEHHYGVHAGSSVDQSQLRTVVVDDVQPKLSAGGPGAVAGPGCPPVR